MVWKKLPLLQETDLASWQRGKAFWVGRGEADTGAPCQKQSKAVFVLASRAALCSASVMHLSDVEQGRYKPMKRRY